MLFTFKKEKDHLIKKLITDKWHVAAYLFITLLLLVGFIIYKDYGIFWDDPYMRRGGFVSLKSVYEYLNIHNILSFFADNAPIPLERMPSLKDYNHNNDTQRFYGVVFDLPVGFLEYIFFGDLGISGEIQKVYSFRNLIRFLVFTLCVWSLYLQAKKIFMSSLAGVVAMIFIVFSPLIFSASFYNHKDIFFMIFVTFGMHTLIKFILTPTIKTAVMHAITTSLAIAMRPMGVFFLPLSLFVIFLFLYSKKNNKILFIKSYVIYFIFSILFVILFFPYLWESPLKNFIAILSYMKKFPVLADSTVLYMGANIHMSDLPWHYIPFWIAVTTPPIILIFFIIGIIILIVNLLKTHPRNYDIQKILLICHLSIVIAPILLVILNKSSLHNGWRQMYFVYPSFILTSTYGFMWIFKKIKIWRYSTFIIGVIFFIFISYQLNWMIKSHPMQNVYFNFLVGSNWKEKFDLDYGGVGNHVMIKNILSTDKRDSISICALSYTPLSHSLYALSKAERDRVKIECSGQPDYLLTNYYKTRNPNLLNNNYKIVNEKKIFDETIITMYKRMN